MHCVVERRSSFLCWVDVWTTSVPVQRASTRTLCIGRLREGTAIVKQRTSPSTEQCGPLGQLCPRSFSSMDSRISAGPLSPAPIVWVKYIADMYPLRAMWILQACSNIIKTVGSLSEWQEDALSIILRCSRQTEHATRRKKRTSKGRLVEWKNGPRSIQNNPDWIWFLRVWDKETEVQRVNICSAEVYNLPYFIF